MRIIHFSDIHAFTGIQNLSGLFDKRLLGTLNYLFRRQRIHSWHWVELAVTTIMDMKPDLVVYTGDLATISEAREFEKAKTALAPIVECCDFEFVYVPGNHDNYINDKACIASYKETFRYMTRDRWSDTDYPQLLHLDDVSLLLTNQVVPAPLHGSWGELSDDSVKWLKSHEAELQAIEHPLILAGHFPLFTSKGEDLSMRRKCRNNNILQDMYRGGIIDISLCGHIHHPYVRMDEPGMEICAGSLTMTGQLSCLNFPSDSVIPEHSWLSL